MKKVSKCGIYGRDFKTQISLGRHEMSHVNEEYKCNLYSFSNENPKRMKFTNCNLTKIREIHTKIRIV